MPVGAPAKLGRSHPDRAQNPGIQRTARVVVAQITGECEAQVGDVAFRARPLVDPDQRRRSERPRRLLEGLARAGIDQRFAGVEVARRLVDANAVLGFLFDQQETAVALDQRGDGDIRLPGALHACILAPLLKWTS